MLKFGWDYIGENIICPNGTMEEDFQYLKSFIDKENFNENFTYEVRDSIIDKWNIYCQKKYGLDAMIAMPDLIEFFDIKHCFPLGEISGDYIYPIELSYSAFSYKSSGSEFENLFEKVINLDRVKDDIFSKKCTVLFMCFHEKGFDESEFIRIFKKFDSLNLPTEQFKFLSNSYRPSNDDINKNIIRFNFFPYLYSLKFFEEPTKYFIDVENKKPKKKFISFNKTPHFHRKRLKSFLSSQDYIKDGYFSYNNQYIIDVEDQYNVDGFSNLNKIYYEDSCFDIVTETCFDSNYFMSEKIFKPIFFKIPFICLGPSFIHDELKQLGYKEYKNIDYSYDKEIDSVNRIGLIKKELKRLLDMSLDELIKSVVIPNKEICEYNYEVLLKNNVHNFSLDLERTING